LNSHTPTLAESLCVINETRAQPGFVEFIHPSRSYNAFTSMVDPLSVSSLAITIVGICGTVANYINTVQTTDAFLDTLGIEVSQLSTVLYELSAQFKNLADRRRVLSADAVNTEPYWVLVKQSLQGCEVSLKRLGGLLQNLNRSHGFINGALVRLRLGKQAPEIDLYKQQIVSYREALKLALHLISV
jgi:hypothetical protein